MSTGTWDALGDLVLEGGRVRLRKLEESDTSDLTRVALDDDIWRYFVVAVKTEADLQALVADARRDTLAGTRAVFAIVERSSGRVVGSTAYGNLAEKERRLEIGWSWLGRAHRGSGINREVKCLLLDHAFGVLGCERVEFKTDALNLRARQALRAIGATEEGILRSFNYMPGGRRRDAVYYSILKHEWPTIRRERFATIAAIAAQHGA